MAYHKGFSIILQDFTCILYQPRLDLRANILEAIEDAQEFRERQVQLMISQLARVAKLSLWDVEATLLAIKVQQTAASLDTHCCTRMTLIRNSGQ